MTRPEVPARTTGPCDEPPSRSVADAFAADGELARCLPGFRVREGQRAMAQDVAELIRGGGALACEAGTGTGKTLAYLMPLLASGRQCIVSTGTRNLQDQLFFRDLPLAQEVLGSRARIALLKGRGNYLCRQRLHAFLEHGRFGDRRVPSDLERIRQWAARTGSGDVAELEDVPEESPAWRYATSTRDNCLGTACPEFDGCHVFEARRRAAQADVVVVNHHLLLAQLALPEEGGDLLPRAPVLVVDEAHQLPGLATEFFGLSLSSGQLEELARDSDLARRTEAVDLPQLSDFAEHVRRSARELHIALEDAARRVAVADLAEHREFAACADRVQRDLEELAEALERVSERGRALAACGARAAELSQCLAALRGTVRESELAWLERHARGFVWRRSPLETGPLLGPSLEARHECVLFTSATLAVAGSLSHFRERVGIGGCEERIYPSPFDYASQALLYFPPEMPEPRSEGFIPRVHACVRDVVGASRGRAFVLFTSLAALARAKRELAPVLDFPVLCQGEAPKSQLLERFRALGNAVLLGSYSFWEGVDVRGDALSCVIIDKLPFAPPDDPMLRARHAALREQGRDPFLEQQLPHAAIALKQGVGRLIRDATDRGVVVICDPRVHRRGYGRRLLASLPPMARTTQPERVRAFFRESVGDEYTDAARERAAPRSSTAADTP